VLEIGSAGAGCLGGVVPAPEPDGVVRMGQGLERVGLRLAERPTLGLQRADGGRGQRGPVVGLDRAEVALRRHVETDRLGDRRPEVLGQEARADGGVPRIERAIVRGIVHHVGDVVQQGRRDQRRGRPVALGGVRGLEHVVGDRHGLSVEGAAAAALHPVEQVPDHRAASTGARSSTARRLRRPSMSA